VYVREIRARIDAYFKLCLRNIRDTIPKTIGHFLVKASQEKLQFELNIKINQNPQLSKSLGEPEAVSERRKSLANILKVLQDALKVLQRDPDIANSSLGDDDLERALQQEMAGSKGAQ
jgi:hypothetical protein